VSGLLAGSCLGARRIHGGGGGGGGGRPGLFCGAWDWERAWAKGLGQ
jgi:hypothetical protein